jgi:hypothetical protein
MSDADKWTVTIYDSQEKIATRTFTGKEEAANEQAEEWATKYFPDQRWTLHHQTQN